MDYDDSSYFRPVQDDDDPGYAPHLEKDYCSNLVLVSHFEENHVTNISPDGAPVPPLSPISPCDAYSASSALTSPGTPYMSTPMSPDPFPTLTSPFTLRKSTFPPVTTFSSHAHAHTHRISPVCKKEEEHVLDTMLPHGVYDSNPGAVAHPQQPLTCHPQIYVPPAHLFLAPARCAPPHYTTSYPSYSLREHVAPTHVYPPSIAPTPVYARHPNLSITTDIHIQLEAEPKAEDEPGLVPLKPAKRQEGENSTSLASEEGVCERGRDVLLGLPQGKAQTHWRRTKASTGMREKIHKCPHAGCIKLYLNRNGLKYHLTKGLRLWACIHRCIDGLAVSSRIIN
ncbi:hypothetical protein K439DRAFT_1664436 [Ramaria rubella]|nr:hypothetical protein K439DRAFT_1664436 [Ramaria rubella]